MEKTNFFGAILVVFLAIDAYAAMPIYSSRLIHRFSDEAQNLWGSKVKNHGSEETTSWPEKKSFGHMRVLLENDLKRQRLKLGTQNQALVASQGGQTFNYGNDMGWYVLFNFHFPHLFFFFVFLFLFFEILLVFLSNVLSICCFL